MYSTTHVGWFQDGEGPFIYDMVIYLRELQRKTKKEQIETVHSGVHPTNGPNCQQRARPQPRHQNSIWVTNVGGRGTAILGYLPLLSQIIGRKVDVNGAVRTHMECWHHRQWRIPLQQNTGHWEKGWGSGMRNSGSADPDAGHKVCFATFKIGLKCLFQYLVVNYIPSFSSTWYHYLMELNYVLMFISYLGTFLSSKLHTFNNHMIISKQNLFQ